MKLVIPLHLISWKKTPNDAERPQRQSQFTPKMIANTVPRLLSSLLWIDQYNECKGMTRFIEFMISECFLPSHCQVGKYFTFKKKKKYYSGYTRKFRPQIFLSISLKKSINLPSVVVKKMSVLEQICGATFDSFFCQGRSVICQIAICHFRKAIMAFEKQNLSFWNTNLPIFSIRQIGEKS